MSLLHKRLQSGYRLRTIETNVSDASDRHFTAPDLLRGRKVSSYHSQVGGGLLCPPTRGDETKYGIHCRGGSAFARYGNGDQRNLLKSIWIWN